MNQVISGSREVLIWDFCAAVLGGDAKLALAQLSALLAQDESEVGILILLAGQVRLATLAAVLSENRMLRIKGGRFASAEVSPEGTAYLPRKKSGEPISNDSLGQAAQRGPAQTCAFLVCGAGGNLPRPAGNAHRRKGDKRRALELVVLEIVAASFNPTRQLRIEQFTQIQRKMFDLRWGKKLDTTMSFRAMGLKRSLGVALMVMAAASSAALAQMVKPPVAMLTAARIGQDYAQGQKPRLIHFTTSKLLRCSFSRRHRSGSNSGPLGSDNTNWLKVEFHYSINPDDPQKNPWIDSVQFKVWIEGRDLYAANVTRWKHGRRGGLPDRFGNLHQRPPGA